MQSNFMRLVFVLILYNYLIINEAVVLFRYAVFTRTLYACIMFAHWAKTFRLFHIVLFRYSLLYVTLPYLML